MLLFNSFEANLQSAHKLLVHFRRLMPASRTSRARRDATPYHRPAAKRRQPPEQELPNGEAPTTRRQRFQRSEERRSGRPHEAGYSEATADPEPAEWETAVTADGRPSVLRCIWRGMHLVRGSLGGAARDGEMRSRVLCDVLYKYTAEGDRRKSIYKHVNNTLGKLLKGAQPKRRSGLEFYTQKLVMAVRLLFDSNAGIRKVYRGMRGELVDLEFYREKQRSREQVQWNSFTSTSMARDAALNFAGDGGVLFVITRDPEHAAAADIHEYSQFPNEQEVLLLPMQVFDVQGVHDRGGHTEIVLREVPHYPAELP